MEVQFNIHYHRRHLVERSGYFQATLMRPSNAGYFSWLTEETSYCHLRPGRVRMTFSALHSLESYTNMLPLMMASMSCLRAVLHISRGLVLAYVSKDGNLARAGRRPLLVRDPRVSSMACIWRKSY